jgi:hypothetical protein
VGGYNIFGHLSNVVKEFINVPPHYQVEVYLNVYFTDSWDCEIFYLKIDGSTLFSGVACYGDSSEYNTNYCGSSYYDWIERPFSNTMIHSLSTMAISFTCNLDEALDNESFGFRDLKVYLYNYCDDTCVTCSANNSPTSCTSCHSFAKLTGGSCVCRDKFFRSTTSDGLSYCAKCDASCATCSGTSTTCSSCYSGFTLTNNVCVSPSSKISIFN